MEAFLALGVIFGSLAIPLALSGSWTAVAWSMEGAGLVWVGVRQQRWTARAFGLLLQIGSGAMFLLGSHGAWTETAVFNSRFLGGMMVGLSGLVSAFFLERYRDRLHRLERAFSGAIMAWGLLWWFGTGLDEIDRRMSRRHEWIGALAYVSLNGMAMGLLFRRVDWKGLRWPAMGLLPAMVMAAAAVADRTDITHPFQGWWMVAWPLAFAVHLYLLRCMDTVWNRTLATGWHVGGALLATGLIGWGSRMAGGSAGRRHPCLVFHCLGHCPGSGRRRADPAPGPGRLALRALGERLPGVAAVPAGARPAGLDGGGCRHRRQSTAVALPAAA